MEKINQALMVLSRTGHAETSLLAGWALNEDYVVALSDINRDLSRCGRRMRLGSHRQRTPVPCENLQNALRDDGCLQRPHASRCTSARSSAAKRWAHRPMSEACSRA